MGCPCPHCASPTAASRRQLFRHALLGEPVPAGFAWYLEQSEKIHPPRSLLVCVGAALLLCSLPGTLLLWWFDAGVPQSLWLLLLLPLLALGVDLVTTLRRYKRWSREWVCNRCRRVFTPSPVLLS